MFLNEYIHLKDGEGEFSKRFLVVMLFDYFLTDDYAELVADIYRTVPQGQYYTDMGIAWGVSVMLIKRFDIAEKLLKEKILSKFVHNKSIQKAIESYRITDEQKAYLRTLKI